MVLCNVGIIYILEFAHYISALEHIGMIILGTYVLLASINTVINNIAHGSFSEMYIVPILGVSSSISQA